LARVVGGPLPKRAKEEEEEMNMTDIQDFGTAAQRLAALDRLAAEGVG
jgi:hypothetical protein